MKSKLSKEELKQRIGILKGMSYRPSKEDIKAFLNPPDPMSKEEIAGRAMVDDDFGMPDRLKKKPGKS